MISAGLQGIEQATNKMVDNKLNSPTKVLDEEDKNSQVVFGKLLDQLPYCHNPYLVIWDLCWDQQEDVQHTGSQ